MSTIPGVSEEQEMEQVEAETPDFASFFGAVAWACLKLFGQVDPLALPRES